MAQAGLSHQEAARKAKKRQRKFLARLKARPPKDLDQQVLDADGQVWEEIDCLSCANCCKTISPTFTQKDIERIAKRLRMRPGEFVEKYLYVDEDDDFVLQQTPCPFLESDNRCRIYEDRPRACRDYPHTGKRKFHLHIAITKKNTLVCPAAFRVVEILEEAYR
ncbi:MAG: YkgJ family cysteine cluster protein [Bacteroidota bacterium]